MTTLESASNTFQGKSQAWYTCVISRVRAGVDACTALSGDVFSHVQWMLEQVDAFVRNGELEKAAGLELSPEHSRVMLCGNPEMIDETRKVLKARDLQLSLSKRPGQVAVENYW